MVSSSSTTHRNTGAFSRMQVQIYTGNKNKIIGKARYDAMMCRTHGTAE